MLTRRLKECLDKLIKLDGYAFFHDPVSVEEVSLRVVTLPPNSSCMRACCGQNFCLKGMLTLFPLRHRWMFALP